MIHFTADSLTNCHHWLWSYQSRAHAAMSWAHPAHPERVTVALDETEACGVKRVRGRVLSELLLPSRAGAESSDWIELGRNAFGLRCELLFENRWLAPQNEDLATQVSLWRTRNGNGCFQAGSIITESSHRNDGLRKWRHMDPLGSTVWEKRKASVKKIRGRTQESDFAGVGVATREWLLAFVCWKGSLWAKLKSCS